MDMLESLVLDFTYFRKQIGYPLGPNEACMSRKIGLKGCYDV